jgi:UDP:flavonoid glycosyltransferase YjiC (YdhE family)
MGTLQNRQRSIFETIAAACADLEAQIVLSLGSRDQALEADIAGAPIVVPFAPQLELLRRATLTITHAGLNTALESLTQGVPMLAIPIANDQPGVASRLEWLGVAAVVPPAGLSVPRLRACVGRMLSEPRYRGQGRGTGRRKSLAQMASHRRPTSLNKPLRSVSRRRARETHCNLLSTLVKYFAEIGYGVSQSRNDKGFSAWQRA